MQRRDFIECVWIVGVLAAAAWGYSGGSGTPNDPYQLATAEDVLELSQSERDWSKHFVLTAHIDLQGQAWRGAVIGEFRGSLDGTGYEIRNLAVSGEAPVGLVGMLYDTGQVKRLGVVNAIVVGADAWSNHNVAILVGSNDGIVDQCYTSGSVRADAYVGGLVGLNKGKVIDCHSAAVVAGEQGVGGLAGRNAYGGEIRRCHSVGSVHGANDVGGLVGSDAGLVIHCVWDIESSGQTASSGGIGLATLQMMDPHHLGLSGWADDQNWRLDAGKGYPRLAWEGRPGQVIPRPNIDWIEGSGSRSDPYRLTDLSQLQRIGQASIFWESQLVLANDIDLDGFVWTEAVLPSFSGQFNGNGFAIENATIVGKRNLGFVGALMPTGRLDHLGVTNANVLGQGDAVGILAGRSNGHLNHCYSSGWVMGEDYVGGLIGYHSDGQLFDCHGTSTVSGNLYVGGLIGQNSDGQLSACHSTSTVMGGEHLGGLIGLNDAGQLNLCRSTSTVVGDLYIGGIVGRNEDEGQLTDCHSAGDLVGNRYVGGLIGYHEDDFSLIVDCSSTAQVTGNRNVDELIGNAPRTQGRGR